MNVGALLIILLLILAFLGCPIVFSIGLATLAALLFDGLPLMTLPQKMFTGFDSTALLAIPFFLLAGNIMSVGLTKRIIHFSNVMIGSVRGSLAIVTVVACAIFAAISGSSIATTAAIGGITLPAMAKEEYPKGFAASITGISSSLGTLIPPSIFLIVFGCATETSIAKLFMAALIPGILLALALVVYVNIYAKKHDFPSRDKATGKEKLEALKDGSWALFMPVLILGGIFLGVFTATEAAAVSAMYAFLVSLLVYRELNWKNFSEVLMQTAVSTAAIVMLAGVSKASSWVIVVSGLPNAILSFFSSITSSWIGLMFLINVLLLIVGMIMEGNSAIIMLTPLIMPLVTAYGISPITFGVVMAMNLSLGLVTPPVGSCLLLANEIAGGNLGSTLKSVIMPLLIGIGVLLLVTYIPPLTQFLPTIMF